MGGGIGGSTDPSTATNRVDVSGNGPASFRYNNPGAQYPSAEAARFGQTGYGIIGGGHKIACFPSPVNGAASNFDLLYRNYTGKTIGEAGRIWTGNNGFGVPGYDPNSILTKQTLDDPNQAIALLKAIAGRESGHGNNLSEEQWQQAHQMFKLGSADAYLHGLPAQAPTNVVAGTQTGAGLLKRAREHIGEEYRNVQVPKDDPNWKGPWDCAEFMSWLVFQEAGILYGCEDDQAQPSKADAYTGDWKKDVERLGIRVSVEQAAATVGGIVLRYPPGPGKMGHIALCDGKGGTVEAKGQRYGVVADTVQGRGWDSGVLVPGIAYDSGPPIKVIPPAVVYALNAPNMSKGIVAKIQEALTARGFDPGVVDGEFGFNTQTAVLAFQEAEGLVVDGAVGPETAAALNVSLTNETPGPVQAGPNVPQQDGGGGKMTAVNNVASVIQQILGLLQTIQTQQTTTPQTTTSTSGAPQQVSTDDIKKALDAIAALLGKSNELGPVNGALGQTIGDLLNGKKTAIGVIGSLATWLLGPGAGGAGSVLGGLVTQLPALAGFSGPAFPIFLAIAAWGILGKFEKWSQAGTPPTS